MEWRKGMYVKLINYEILYSQELGAIAVVTLAHQDNLGGKVRFLDGSTSEYGYYEDFEIVPGYATNLAKVLRGEKI